MFQTPEPTVRVRVFEFVDEKYPMETSKLLASNVPAVRVRTLVAPRVRLSVSVYVPEGAFTVSPIGTETPFVVIVFAPLPVRDKVSS
jgi:hypothetical protein